MRFGLMYIAPLAVGDLVANHDIMTGQSREDALTRCDINLSPSNGASSDTPVHAVPMYHILFSHINLLEREPLRGVAKSHAEATCTRLRRVTFIVIFLA